VAGGINIALFPAFAPQAAEVVAQSPKGSDPKQLAKTPAFAFGHFTVVIGVLLFV
jgi:hypothetical protein